MEPVYIAAARRTPIGKLRGSLSVMRPDDLGAEVVCDLVAGLPELDPAEIDDIYWGNANGAGEENRNIARMLVLLAGLPESVPGASLNRLCASGMEAFTVAARTIAAGEADILIAGGVESMSRAPFVVPRPEDALPNKMEMFDTRLGWRLTNPRMKELHGVLSMGETAEEVATRYAISRERQDEFALASHRKAAAAWEAGHFDAEVLTVATPMCTQVSRDECIRPDTSLEKLGSLKPVFRKGGSVTAGNSSPMNDGAAGLVLASEAGLARLGVEPLARYVAGASAGVHPDIMGVGPIPAVRRVLTRSGWKIEDVQTAELNEAFAAQRVPKGDGARIITTLVHRMRREGLSRGLATMCVGVGQGTAVLIERN
jgi:acetyl-CoA acyltransferase